MVLVLTTGLSFLVVTPFSTAIVSSGYKGGMDLDVMAHPVESTLTDLMITTCYVLGLHFYFSFGSIAYTAIAVFDVLCFVMCAILAFLGRRSSDFLNTIKESLMALTICSIVVNVTGILLLNASTRLEEIKEVFIVYPALIGTVGHVGLMVGSVLTTGLALGSLNAPTRKFTLIAPEIAGIWFGSAVIFALFSAITSFFYHQMEPTLFLRFTVFLMLVNVLACLAILLISIGIAMLTYARGLDPDAFAMPIRSSLADCATTAAILIALTIFPIVV